MSGSKAYQKHMYTCTSKHIHSRFILTMYAWASMDVVITVFLFNESVYPGLAKILSEYSDCVLTATQTDIHQFWNFAWMRKAKDTHTRKCASVYLCMPFYTRIYCAMH